MCCRTKGAHATLTVPTARVSSSAAPRRWDQNTRIREMAYVPPSQRGGNFKSRAEGETIPTLTTANLKDEPEEKSPNGSTTMAPGRSGRSAPTQGSWVRGSANAGPPMTPRDDARPGPGDFAKGGNKAKTSADKSAPQACAFFATKGECGKGAACRFSHKEEDIAAFLEAGGFDAFANKRKSRDAEKADKEAEKKAAKKEARRLAKQGPQGPKMKTGSGEEADGDGMDSWAYVPKTKAGDSSAKFLAPVPTQQVAANPFAAVERVAEEPSSDWMNQPASTNWGDDDEPAPAAAVESEESESSSESESEDPAPKPKKKSVLAPVPLQPSKTLSAKELKAQKKAAEMAELEAALADVGIESAAAKPDEAATAGETAAAKKKREKKERQKAAAGAAKAGASEGAKEVESTAAEPTDEQKVEAAAAKLAKLQEATKKKLETKKGGDKKKAGKMTEKDKAKAAKEKKKAKAKKAVS